MTAGLMAPRKVKTMKRTIALISVLLAVGSAGVAKNVDLVTLPTRDRVQLTIYNSEDITLVKEIRSVTLRRGANKLQFSWANTLIDPTSVMIRPLDHKDDIEVVDTVFPGQKPQHLFWNIESQFEGQVRMEVTYFTSGLTWSMDYVAIADADEEVMSFDGYVRVYNNSGEEYDNAEIRLIVGTINLVEKIAQLARDRGIPMPEGKSRVYGRMGQDALYEAMDENEAGGWADDIDTHFLIDAPKIVKEGLSEYFMFSVGGRETIPNGWSKRIQAVDADDVSFDIVYRMRGHQYGARPVRFFIWSNDDEHSLGESPLPDGRVNLFRDNGEDGLSFLGSQQVNYVPIKADIEINLGPDDLVVYETKKMSTKRTDFEFGPPQPEPLPQPRPRRGRAGVAAKEYVDGLDETTDWVDTIRNYRDKPITFELRRVWAGDVEYESEVATTLFDYRTTETTFTIGPREKTEYPATVTLHLGSRAKQASVKLKE